MPLDELCVMPRVAGFRAVERALIRGTVRKVFIASDADGAMREKIARLAENRGVPVESAPDMQVLGRACALCRKASVAAILGEDGEGSRGRV
ncbi:L7Ae/L30e/S12e/Gadd45 family ribosomal protein [Aminiphilus circumscriptus]|jgi:large subunit ribosomal protein L7A|uniref:L7Ae/L30e/S12e/Gadd45 family ribosomal protein n=1 Tax=Aminiphilus circumscriptus TaxID=290732 RepID=UPI0004929932|nr:ribosomal L7Ae/L30e/S12e/Gadd45 family protein [Aminiphilus circumscriptus]